MSQRDLLSTSSRIDMLADASAAMTSTDGVFNHRERRPRGGDRDQRPRAARAAEG